MPRVSGQPHLTSDPLISLPSTLPTLLHKETAGYSSLTESLPRKPSRVRQTDLKPRHSSSTRRSADLIKLLLKPENLPSLTRKFPHTSKSRAASESSTRPATRSSTPRQSSSTREARKVKEGASNSRNNKDNKFLNAGSQHEHMGNCVSRNGSPAGGIGPESDKVAAETMQFQKPQMIPRSSLPNTPIDLLCCNILKERERRRLSLSQSDPAKADLNGDQARGQFFIRNQEQNHDVNKVAHAYEALRWERARRKTASKVSGKNCRKKSLEDEREKDDVSPPFPPVSKNGVKPCRRLSVSGAPSSLKQDNFEVKSDTGYFDPHTLLGLGIGYTCKKGLKPESPNQDDFFIVRVADWGLYGVFDGHGPYGHDVSHFVQRELPKLIYNSSCFHQDPKEALRHSFISVHKMLEDSAATRNSFDCSLSGTTATVVLHRKSKGKLYVAHVGDSRCILGRLSKNGKKVEAIDLTKDHKPNSESEKKRIVLSGGQVRRLEGDIPYRVFLKGRLYPGLAMSRTLNRAIGDSLGRQAGVISEPDVTEHSVDPERDLFISLCSDGVWEFLDSSEVARVIFSHGVTRVQSAADALAKESWNRWIQKEGNVVDDITAEIIFLCPEKMMR